MNASVSSAKACPRDSRGGWGIAYAVGAYVLWGMFPLYFKAVAGVPALEVLAHRVVWSLAVCAVLVSLRGGGWPQIIASFRSRRLLATLSCSAAAIAVNWGVFIWAVDAGRLLECSSMLGICFLEKGMPKLAVKWFEKGLEAPGRSDEEYLGLRYDLASAYEADGDLNRAVGILIDLHGQDPQFRDVGERLRALRAAGARS